jgi:tryptophan synthase beta chain
VHEQLLAWRPTPLFRAERFEEALGLRGPRIYVKYEGANLTGSHKLNTAVAQAYYYRAAGVETLVAGTGAGQWGSAVAAACRMFGMACRVYMVRSSCRDKPYRKTIMRLLGAEVLESPTDGTGVGRAALADDPQGAGTLSIALGEALENATSSPRSRFCTGSGETYSLLHQTVIGLEALVQMRDRDDYPDAIVAGVGAGSNFGGLANPFLGETLRGGGPATRLLAVEPAACPKFTRGTYAYDHTDASRLSPLQKMYTLGHTYRPPALHAGGLRYHGSAKLLSAMYHRRLFEAAAYPQRDVFESAALFGCSEGIVPAPESAHAIHGAAMLARTLGRHSGAILVGLSGHGLYDMAAYDRYVDGAVENVSFDQAEIDEALAGLPVQPVLSGGVVDRER